MSRKPGQHGDEWQEAKRRCGLSEEEVRMAKELGLAPRSLIKNIPAKSQPWKAPVSQWIRDLYARIFGEARRSPAIEGKSRSLPAKPTVSRIPVPISQPKGRITTQTIAEVAKRIEGLDLAAKANLCDELAAHQPVALGWVLLLQREGVSLSVVDHVLHLLLVISECVKETIREPLPCITEDDFEKAGQRIHAMFMLLQREPKEEAKWLTYLMAESHPERNLYAYVVNRLSHEAKAHERRGDERAIYCTAVLLEAFLQRAGLIKNCETMSALHNRSGLHNGTGVCTTEQAVALAAVEKIIGGRLSSHTPQKQRRQAQADKLFRAPSAHYANTP